MKREEASNILERLLEGIHPVTGEILPEDHVCCEAEVLRALHKAIDALRREETQNWELQQRDEKEKSQLRERQKKIWTNEQDEYLRKACEQNVSMDEICSVLRRKESQIKFRMVYLGLKERSILGKSIYPQNGYAHQGLPWYPEEEEKLRKLYLEGKTPQQMSAGIQRSISSIMIRLERMGLIKDQHEYVPPESIRF